MKLTDITLNNLYTFNRFRRNVSSLQLLMKKEINSFGTEMLYSSTIATTYLMKNSDTWSTSIYLVIRKQEDKNSVLFKKSYVYFLFKSTYSKSIGKCMIFFILTSLLLCFFYLPSYLKKISFFDRS